MRNYFCLGEPKIGILKVKFLHKIVVFKINHIFEYFYFRI
ncbi:hypothetical protein LEP1GSC082_1835 [Leptospira kirschneri str. H2]|uniref:Uncharacterized protein n=2 Tax=Leptospira kirschneri TaxID=29507 RepID=A0A0E2B1J5_9LEPT|nr:hypothetical protein LEP1GSC081_4452 [Leptospira kirschneri str. H1]EKO61007.1 hypothetical protein LEP1GSC082_1835 [Leptospira kirschneri str. H2]EMK25551.1 hypothetical protein LEP1GSC008_0777 [Leptospira kirschneri serovar Bulgarica str. Nikolaevo]